MRVTAQLINTRDGTHRWSNTYDRPFGDVLKLQDELAGTENRIAVERQRYNDTIQAYNTYIGLFPNNIVASIAGFKRNDAYFKATEASREVPKVEFPPPNR